MTATTHDPVPSLTDRYVDETVKHLPTASRRDVRDELHASIVDAAEARLAEGEHPDAAERAVLDGLGDPAVLAARYADRPLQLIGPRYYLPWLRLLRLLLIIVPTCAFVGVALGQAIADAPIGEIIGQSIGVALTTVVHIAFWVTLVFAVLERTGADPGESWTVDRLPEPHTSGTGRSELIASLVFLAIVVGAILWDRRIGFLRVEGEPLPILDAGLWPWWIVALFALVAAEAVFAVVLFLRGRWSLPLATANTVLAVLGAGWWLAAIGRGMLVNPDFVDAVFTAHGVDEATVRILSIILAILVATGAVVVAVLDVVDGWRKQRRDAVA